MTEMVLKSVWCSQEPSSLHCLKTNNYAEGHIQILQQYIISHLNQK